MPERARLGDLAATPHATVFDDRPRTVRLALEAGETVPGHRHPGEWVVIHVVEGELTVHVDGTAHDLVADELLRVSGDREIEPAAVADAVAIVTFAPARD